jgi:hypothetical protein
MERKQEKVPELDEPEDDERFLEFTAQVLEAERNGERATFTIGPFSLLTMIGAIQLATRHPHVVGENRKILLGLVQDFGVYFDGTAGEEIIKRGSHPEWDVKNPEDRSN